ncbi:hypothetical protein KSB_01210 [Ktedonobacter robiniae]|uniref:MBL fold metallo-hydrolase n=1 Tax=Ktedonobacter robiniae TaxID=2778365 RepID=A0ABQ3UG06_9CHLR|nr:hypothetical protein KSB_01210 [Ktedonobacter robiniae]
MYVVDWLEPAHDIHLTPPAPQARRHTTQLGLLGEILLDKQAILLFDFGGDT